MTSHAEIRDTVARYLARFPEEAEPLARLTEALDGSGDLASRSTIPPHVTCGAAVVNDRGQVLMLHRRALDPWLLPGGHIEQHDASLVGAALRELEEETSIPWQQAVSPPALDTTPLDIDVHEIPANPAKGEPAHWHADLRYAFWSRDTDVRLQLEEVTAFAWRDPGDLHTVRLTGKVAAYA
ncbi:hypothetical protein GCM10023194_25570 [Planotetraspora phitsanulokensis]|uniref:Nudix hydrolase domain-containing protein n=1 Tax=Planotetraspora phitsanulokensis TaxID=575192 RepID=A0A8J3UAQ2_9ACTN|nr:NUDIX domain-containing protein [Planotetraspora phitsanulokensis]GII41904.1 hypothetical protein Pph01_69070 [Planotetraspora phitsanulokensis]